MSTIKSSTTLTTAYQVVADTTGALVIQTGATPTTAVTVSSAQVVTLANALPVASGGTGQTSYTDGQLLIGNTSGNTLAKATLTQGSGISITNGAGSITIASTAAGGFSNMVVLTSTNASYSIPATKIKVTLVAGGGGSGAAQDNCGGGTTGGGGSGGAAVQLFSGLTIGNTLNITVGAGGTAGAAGGANAGGTGGTSSVASGSQSISTVSATGGAGSGSASNGTSASGVGGNGSGGLLNIKGYAGFTPNNTGPMGGASILGGNAIYQNTGSQYGGGAGGQGSNSGTYRAGFAGAAGVVIVEY